MVWVLDLFIVKHLRVHRLQHKQHGRPGGFCTAGGLAWSPPRPVPRRPHAAGSLPFLCKRVSGVSRGLCRLFLVAAGYYGVWMLPPGLQCLGSWGVTGVSSPRARWAQGGHRAFLQRAFPSLSPHRGQLQPQKPGCWLFSPGFVFHLVLVCWCFGRPVRVGCLHP